jgi:hypothetical protein
VIVIRFSWATGSRVRSALGLAHFAPKEMPARSARAAGARTAHPGIGCPCIAAILLFVHPGKAAAQILAGEVHASSQNQYNDNFQGLASNQPPAANSSRGDFSTTDSVGASGTAEVGRQLLFASGEVGKTLYLRSSVFDSQLYLFSGGVRWQATSACSGDITVSFDQHQSDLQELTVPVANQSQTTSYGGSGLCNVGSRYWAGLDAKRLDVTNSAPTEQTANRQETNVKGHFYYQLPTLSKLGTDLGYVERVFPQSSQTVNEYDVGLVFERKLGQKTYLSSQVGIAALTTSGTATGAGSAGSATSYNPTVNLNVSYSATAKVAANLLLSRAVQSSDEVVSSVTIVDTASLGVTWQVSPKVSASENAAYTISDFQGGISSSGASVGTLQQSREDRRFRNIMSVNYALARRLTLNAQYLFTDQNSTLATRTFTSNAIFFGLRVTY